MECIDATLRASLQHRPRAFPFPIHRIASHPAGYRQGKILLCTPPPAYYTACTVYRSLCSIPIIITVRLRGRPGIEGVHRLGENAGRPTESCGEDAGSLYRQGGPLRNGHGGIWHCCVPSSVLDQEHGTAARARTRRIPRPKNVAPHSLPPRSKQARQTLGEPDAGRREKSGVGPRRTAYCVVLCCQKTKEYSVDKSIRNPGCLRQQSNALHATWFPPPARLGGNGRSLCLWRRIKTSGTPVTFLQLCGRPFSACSTNQKPPLQGHQVYSGLQVFLVSATAGSITAVTGAAKENSD